MAGTVHGALITPVSASNVPVFNTASVFNCSQPGNVHRLQPGTSFIPQGFDVRDLFNGSFGTYRLEQSDVIFNDGQPAGTVNAAGVKLGSPTSFTSFNLYLEDGWTNRNRSASEFEQRPRTDGYLTSHNRKRGVVKPSQTNLMEFSTHPV